MSIGQIMPIGQIMRRKAQFIGTANGRPYGGDLRADCPRYSLIVT